MQTNSRIKENLTPKAQSTNEKIDRLDFMKIKHFCFGPEKILFVLDYIENS